MDHESEDEDEYEYESGSGSGEDEDDDSFGHAEVVGTTLCLEEDGGSRVMAAPAVAFRPVVTGPLRVEVGGPVDS